MILLVISVKQVYEAIYEICFKSSSGGVPASSLSLAYKTLKTPSSRYSGWDKDGRGACIILMGQNENRMIELNRNKYLLSSIGELTEKLKIHTVFSFTVLSLKRSID